MDDCERPGREPFTQALKTTVGAPGHRPCRGAAGLPV